MLFAKEASLPLETRRAWRASAALAASAELRGLASFSSSPILGVNLWLDREIVDAPFVGLLGTTLHWLFNKGDMLSASKSPEARGPRAAAYLALVASGARGLVDRDAPSLIELALGDLRSVFPRARNARLVHATVVKEREATTSPAVGWESLRPGPRTAKRRLLLAGDWTATGLPATIESAAMSGHLAASAHLEDA